MRQRVGHTNAVKAIAFCQDGRLVSGSTDRTVRIWDPSNWETIQTIRAGTPVYSIAIARHDGTIAYAGRHPGEAVGATPIQTYRPAEKQAGNEVEFPYQRSPASLAAYYPNGIARSVWSLSYSSDGVYLAAAGRVMGGGNIPNGGGGHSFLTSNESVHGPLADTSAYSLTFAPDGNRLAVTASATVRVYAHPRNQEPVVSYGLQSTWAAAVTFVPGSPLVAVGVNNAIYFADATEQKRKPRKVKSGFRRITAIAALPDGRRVIVGGRPEGVEVYDPATAELVVRYDFGLGGINGVAVAPDGLTFAVAGEEGVGAYDWDS